jgi:hypothetical protein
VVNAAHHASGDHPLLAEDPEPGVDHEVLAAGVSGGFVDLADVAVGSVHVVAHDVTGRRRN